MVITLNKLDAIKKIMDAPGDTVNLVVMDEKELTHEDVKIIDKESGNKYINMAEQILYTDNSFFGIMLLEHIVKEKPERIHRIMFPQKE